MKKESVCSHCSKEFALTFENEILGIREADVPGAFCSWKCLEKHYWQIWPMPGRADLNKFDRLRLTAWQLPFAMR